MRHVVGSTLLRARGLHEEDLSRRELADRISRALGHPRAIGAIEQLISATERAPQTVIVPDELVGLLEVELGLEVGDLSHSYRWAYRLTGVRSAPDRPAWLGGRLPVFSSAVGAYAARDWVTYGEGRVIRELELAHPYEIFHGELERTVGGDWALVATDPTRAEFMALAGRPLAA